jgi:hypothetical protein
LIKNLFVNAKYENWDNTGGLCNGCKMESME